VSVIHNIFRNHHCDSPIILKWKEDQQDGDIDVPGLIERYILSEDAKLTAIDDQGKCYNNLKQTLGSGILQNTRSDATQSAYSVTVQSLDCGFSDLDNTLSDVTQSANGIPVQSSDYRPQVRKFSVSQSIICQRTI
jgi:hypothetical protein